jgi:hypothetical protein
VVHVDTQGAHSGEIRELHPLDAQAGASDPRRVI